MARPFAEPDDRSSGSGSPAAGADPPSPPLSGEDLRIGRDEEDRLDALENASANPRRLWRTDLVMFLIHVAVTAALIAIIVVLARRHGRTSPPAPAGSGAASHPAGR